MASNGSQGGRRRKRTKFNKNQVQVLIEAFERNRYPDFTVREDLASRIQIPEPRIQIWFQNRRARQQKSTARRPRAEAVAPAPGSHQDGSHGPDSSSSEGLLPRSDSSASLQSYAGQFSWQLGDSSGPAMLSGDASVLNVNVTTPDLQTPASTSRGPSGDVYHASASGFSHAAPGPLSAPQQPSELEAGATGVHWGYWLLQGWGQDPHSGEQPLREDWQSPPALQPGMAPLQPPSQHPGVWEQPTAPPPLSAQEPWPNPADPSALCLHLKLEEVPAGYQGQCPSHPPSQDLGGKPWDTLVPTHCSFGSNL